MNRHAGNSVLRAAGWTCALLSLLLVAGCEGCFRSQDEPQADQTQNKDNPAQERKPDFDSLAPVLLPGVVNNPIQMKRQLRRIQNDPVRLEIERMRRESQARNYAKLGHWQEARFQVIANQFDANAELETTTLQTSGLLTPQTLPGTDYYMTSNRPVALPKGQWKTFDTSLYIPANRGSGAATLRCALQRPGGGMTRYEQPAVLRTLSSYQHHMVVLSTRPESFQFLELAPSVRLPGRTSEGGRFEPFYVVITSNQELPAPLPRQLLHWTTTAYLIWDDLDPDQLDPDQQQALRDWLRFGGQLILSGPDCLQRLESSFLADDLPAQVAQVQNLDENDLAMLNQKWGLADSQVAGTRRELQVDQDEPLLGVDFRPHVEAQEIPGTGGLVIERPLGRGRIVATAFSLAAPAVRSWRSFDSFFNGALLRRRPRQYSLNSGGVWQELKFEWLDTASPRDPLMYTGLRFLSRDLGDAQGNDPWREISSDEMRVIVDPWRYGGWESQRVAGLGGWNDASGISIAARETLGEAASIRPPSRNLVLQLLIGYLIILVPVNWALFWALGRVEWAWVVTPLLAIAGAALVIRVAALDIGFVRSQTQVALLEIPAGYSRGHLTEYSALYSSLSTGYQVELHDHGSQALPLSVGKTDIDLALRRHVSLDQQGLSRLQGLQVQSNSTEFLHAEHVLDLGGTFDFQVADNGQGRLINQTPLGLEAAYVVGRRRVGGRLDTVVAPIGELASGAVTTLEFKPDSDFFRRYQAQDRMANSAREAREIWDTRVDQNTVTIDQLRQIPELAENWAQDQNRILQAFRQEEYGLNKEQFIDLYQQLRPASDVTLGRLWDQIDRGLALGEGQYCLIGTTSEPLGRTRFEPAATQVDRQTLVVAHLTPPPRRTALPDVNAPADFPIEDAPDPELPLFNRP